VTFDFGRTYGCQTCRLRGEISRSDLYWLCLAMALLKALSEVPMVFFSR